LLKYIFCPNRVYKFFFKYRIEKIKEWIEVTGRRLTRLLEDLKEERVYFQVKEEALDRTMWRAGFGRSFGPVMRQTAK
jgi:hypothetical protein